MLASTGGTEVEVDELTRQLVALDKIEGVTIVGGEPFWQPEALAEICRQTQALGLSVMVFTGFVLEELRQKSKPAIERALSQIDLLVDGPFDQSQPETQRRWIGSANQVLHFLTDRYRPTDPVFWADNTVEIRFDGREITVNGWPVSLQAKGMTVRY